MATLLRITGEVLREYIFRSMEHVTSADKAFHWLQTQGVYAPRSEVRETWHEVGKEDMWTTVLATYGIEKAPPRAWTVDWGRELKEKYLYHFKVTEIDKETGIKYEYNLSRYEDKLLSFADVWGDIETEAEEYAEDRGHYFVSWSIAGIERRR